MNTPKEISIHAQLLPQLAHSTGIMIIGHDHANRKDYMGRMEWDEITDKTFLGTRQPFTFYVPEHDARTLQMLMDDLWRIGVRPSGEFHGTAGQLAQAEKHIADLRTIAFSSLKITPVAPQR